MWPAGQKRGHTGRHSTSIKPGPTAELAVVVKRVKLPVTRTGGEHHEVREARSSALRFAARAHARQRPASGRGCCEPVPPLVSSQATEWKGLRDAPEAFSIPGMVCAESTLPKIGLDGRCSAALSCTR